MIIDPAQHPEESDETGLCLDVRDGCVVLKVWDGITQLEAVMDTNDFLEWVEDLNKIAWDLRS